MITPNIFTLLLSLLLGVFSCSLFANQTFKNNHDLTGTISCRVLNGSTDQCTSRIATINRSQLNTTTFLSGTCNPGYSLPINVQSNLSCDNTPRFNVPLSAITQCPTNSTSVIVNNDHLCQPLEGFTAWQNPVNNYAWTVTQNGTACSSGVGDNLGSGNPTCTCSTESSPVKVLSSTSTTSNPIYVCQSNLSDELTAWGVILTGLGLNTALLLGAFSVGGCIVTLIICTGAIGVATIGALFTGIGLTMDDDPSIGVNTGAPLLVTLSQPTATASPIPEPNKIKYGPQGELVPPSNATSVGAGRWAISSGSTTATMNTTTNTTTITDSGLANMAMSYSSGAGGAMTMTSARAMPFGTSSSTSTTSQPSAPITRLENTNIPLNRGSTLPQSQGTTEIRYTDGQTVTTQPPPMSNCVHADCSTVVITPPSDGGTPPTGGDGTDPTSSGGDCDKEPQKCAILTNINGTLNGQGTNGQVVLTQVSTQMDATLNQYRDQATELINDFYNTDLWANQFLSKISDAPNPFTPLQQMQGDCQIDLNLPGGVQNLSVCAHMPHIHGAIAFGTFILLLFGIRDLILEKETN